MGPFRSLEKIPAGHLAGAFEERGRVFFKSLKTPTFSNEDPDQKPDRILENRAKGPHRGMGGARQLFDRALSQIGDGWRSEWRRSKKKKH